MHSHRTVRRLAAAAAALLFCSACSDPEAASTGSPLAGEQLVEDAPWVLRLGSDPGRQLAGQDAPGGAVVVDVAAVSKVAAAPLQVLRLDVVDLVASATRLATVLRLEGPARWEQGSLHFGDLSGVAAALTVAYDGQWQYIAGRDESGDDESGAEASGSRCAGFVARECGPTGRQVEEAAQQWLRLIDPEARTAPWQTQPEAVIYASASRLLDTVPSGLVWGFGFGPDLQLRYAHGWLATATPAAAVGTLAPAALVPRLQQQLTGWTDPQSALTPSTFMVRSAQIELVPVQDVDGVWWLVPGYRFNIDPGTSAAPFDLVVIALEDRHMVHDDGTGETEASELAADPERVQSAAEQVIGMFEEDAIAWLEQQGLLARVTARDGEPAGFSGQYRPDRVALAVVDTKVVAADPG